MTSDDLNISLSGNAKKDIVMPGAIVHSVNANKVNNNKIKIEYFSIGPEADDSKALEALLNREDIFIIDWHKYTFQYAFMSVITYSVTSDKKEEDGTKEVTSKV